MLVNNHSSVTAKIVLKMIWDRPAKIGKMIKNHVIIVLNVKVTIAEGISLLHLSNKSNCY